MGKHFRVESRKLLKYKVKPGNELTPSTLNLQLLTCRYEVAT